MIITISGKPGAGKSALAERLAKELNYKRYSPGKIRREMADKQGLSISELNSQDKVNPITDEIVDKRIIEFSKNIIVDGRVGYFFLPKSLKIFLDADLKVVAKWLVKDPNRKSEPITSEKQAFEELKERCKEDQARFMKLYKTDIYDLNNFDLVIDTSNLTEHQVFKKVLEKLK